MNLEEKQLIQRLKILLEKELKLSLTDEEVIESYKNLILLGKAIHEYYSLKGGKS